LFANTHVKKKQKSFFFFFFFGGPHNHKLGNHRNVQKTHHKMRIQHNIKLMYYTRRPGIMSPVSRTHSQVQPREHPEVRGGGEKGKQACQCACMTWDVSMYVICSTSQKSECKSEWGVCACIVHTRHMFEHW
jgi:hypothetical protein